MAFISTHPLFRNLTDKEEKEFRQYAQENDPPSNRWSIFHPICRDEWEKRGITEETLLQIEKKQSLCKEC